LPGQSTGDEDIRITFRVDDNGVVTILNRELVQIGNIDVGDFVQVSINGIEIYANNTLHFHAQGDGDLFIGEDITDPSKTYLAVFVNAQTYNSESMAAGDMLFGDNSSGKANILWDKSEGRLLFRGGTTTALFLDTDGTLTAGGGNVLLDAAGLTIVAGSTGQSKRIKFLEGSDSLLEIYAAEDPGVYGQATIVAAGPDSDTHEGYMELIAITDDGTAHAGAASVSITLATDNDRIELTAEEVRISTMLRLIGITTTQRNALTAADGMLVYNTTDSKFQGRAGGSWVDLH